MGEQFVRLLASKTPAERVSMASSMFDSAVILMRAGILSEDNHLGEAQIRTKIFCRLYGDCFTRTEMMNIISHLEDMDTHAASRKFISVPFTGQQGVVFGLMT